MRPSVVSVLVRVRPGGPTDRQACSLLEPQPLEHPVPRQLHDRGGSRRWHGSDRMIAASHLVTERRDIDHRDRRLARERERDLLLNAIEDSPRRTWSETPTNIETRCSVSVWRACRRDADEHAALRASAEQRHRRGARSVTPGMRRLPRAIRQDPKGGRSALPRGLWVRASRWSR